MSKKDMDRRKKFILELMGDPIYQPMRLREISSLLRLQKKRKESYMMFWTNLRGRKGICRPQGQI